MICFIAFTIKGQKKPGPIKVMLVFIHGFKLCMQATLDDLIFGFYDQRPNKHRSGAFTGNFVVRVVHGLFNFCIQATINDLFHGL